jgi:hypothetical protein
MQLVLWVALLGTLGALALQQTVSSAVSPWLQALHRGATLLVDGNNLRGKLSFQPPEQLCLVVDAWRQSQGLSCPIEVVLDHGFQAQTLDAAGLSVSFSGPDRSADDVLSHRIVQLQRLEGRDVVLVTEDLVLRKRCRSKAMNSRLSKKQVKKGLIDAALAERQLNIVTSRCFAECLAHIACSMDENMNREDIDHSIVNMQDDEYFKETSDLVLGLRKVQGIERLIASSKCSRDRKKELQPTLQSLSQSLGLCQRDRADVEREILARADNCIKTRQCIRRLPIHNSTIDCINNVNKIEEEVWERFVQAELFRRKLLLS